MSDPPALDARIRLDGRRALVCGASAGIGRAVARELAQLGAEVVLLARRREPLETLARELAAIPGVARPELLVADLDELEVAERAVERLLATTGDIAILVHNTGGPPPGPLLGAALEELDRALRRHLHSAHRLLGLLLPGMRRAGYGRIVNVLSTSVREPIPGLGVSNIVRAAVAAWSKTLVRELPPGVTINSVLPGYTDTERLAALQTNVARRRGVSPEDIAAEWMAQVPEGRLGTPQEIAAAVAFLASPAAAYIRGVHLAVDGGRLRGL